MKEGNQLEVGWQGEENREKQRKRNRCERWKDHVTAATVRQRAGMRALELRARPSD